MSRMMMMCAVHDAAINEFMQPFFARSEAEVKRMMFSAVAEDNNISRSPQDFSVFHLADFDSALGVVQPLESIVCLVSAQELIVTRRASANGGQPHVDPRQVDLED